MQFYCDGAAVMNGQHLGVVKRLKANNRLMVAIHCVTPRQALAAVQSAESVPY